MYVSVSASTGNGAGEEWEGAHDGSKTLFWRPMDAHFCSGMVATIFTGGIGRCDRDGDAQCGITVILSHHGLSEDLWLRRHSYRTEGVVK